MLMMSRVGTLVPVAVAALSLVLPSCHARQAGTVGAAASRPAAMAAAAGTTVAMPQFPSISPDGSMIVFAWAGDLWAMDAGGGTAKRLTSHPADEARSAFSPDGSLLAFESDRHGARNIYVMPISREASGMIVAGAVRRVTMSDRPQALGGFSDDGKEILFTSSHEPAIFRAPRMLAAPVPTAEASDVLPIRRLTDAFGSAPHAAGGGSVLFHRTRHDPTRPGYFGSGAPDVFRMDASGKVFTRLTADPYPDSGAYGLPDGSTVWVSSRPIDGVTQFNVWRMPAGVSEPDRGAQPVTRFKPGAGEASIGHGVQDFLVAPGGWHGVFVVWDTLYTIDFRQTPATPRAVPIVASGDTADLDTIRLNAGRQVSSAALSPDGKTIATIARGEVFVRSTERDHPTRRVTGPGPAGALRARDVAWSACGSHLYFTADSPAGGGVTAIYRASVRLSREDVTPAATRSETPTEARAEGGAGGTAGGSGGEAGGAAGGGAGRRGEASRPDPGKRWAESLTFTFEPFLTDADDLRSPLPSPDGRRMMVTRGYGELILIDLEALAKARADGATGTGLDGAFSRTVHTNWTDSDVQWAGDSRHVVFSTQDVHFNSDIFLLDTQAEPGSAGARPVNLSQHPDLDTSPRLSADGKVLYFLSDRDSDSNGQFALYAVNLDRKLDGLRPYELAQYYKDASEAARRRRPPAPLGSRAERPARGAGEAAAAKADPDAPKPEAPTEPDTRPAGEPKADAPADGTKPDAAKAEPAKAAGFVYEADDLSTAFRRIRRVSGVPDRVGNLAITPSGDRVIVTATSEGTPSLVSFDYNGRERRVVFAGGASGVEVNLAGDRVLFISGGRATPPGAGDDDAPRAAGGDVYLGRPAGGEADRLPIDAPLVVDVASQQRQKFLDAARAIGTRFYHPTMKGVDWAALTERYLSLAQRTRTDAEFNRVFNMLLGELDASHMGISGGRSTAGEGTPLGYLGIESRPVAGGFEVTRVLRNGPADRVTSRLSVGDVITSVAGRTLAPAADRPPSIDLHAALAGTVGQETLLEVTPAGGGAMRVVVITPMSAGADANLRYQEEVRRNSERVSELSGGRLGYLHIRGMDLASVREFERDLFAAADGKDGLVIDVRDNGGGFTTDILLSSLTAPNHSRTFARGMDLSTLPSDAYPRDRRLIYAYTRPISVLINQNSFSNAEIFAHAIKTIGRGRLVGTATFGGVISTGSYRLNDGTTIRMPFRGWWLPGDIDMENNGAQPDVPVPQLPQDEAQGRDPQLEAAVKELLERIGKR